MSESRFQSHRIRTLVYVAIRNGVEISLGRYEFRLVDRKRRARIAGGATETRRARCLKWGKYRLFFLHVRITVVGSDDPRSVAPWSWRKRLQCRCNAHKLINRQRREGHSIPPGLRLLTTDKRPSHDRYWWQSVLLTDDVIGRIYTQIISTTDRKIGCRVGSVAFGICALMMCNGATPLLFVSERCTTRDPITRDFIQKYWGTI